ncbi:MAG: thiamine phosphate synthase [Pseudomonadota bacterium]|nr:thiamine phosphate synthase [Pseudomonadota bacterium]
MIMSLRGLYAITDAALIPADQLMTAVSQALIGGAQLIQYRDKTNAYAKRRQQATALHQWCQRYQCPLIINDDIQLAHAIQAEGVHLGQEDNDITTARQLLGAQAIIGISCHNRLDLAQQACAAGASYVAFGRFFASLTKPEAVAADIALLSEAKKLLSKPIVAIGGITPDNGAQLIAAGADCLAVIQGLWGSEDITATARRYAQLFH